VEIANKYVQDELVGAIKDMKIFCLSPEKMCRLNKGQMQSSGNQLSNELVLGLP